MKKILIHPYANNLREGGVSPKNYPYFPELLGLLRQDGSVIAQIGREGEDQLCETFHKNLPISQISEILKESEFFISVDSFLPHLAILHGVRGVVLWGPSDPKIYGYENNLNISGGRPRKDQGLFYSKADIDPSRFVSAKEVYEKIRIEWP
jgi:ADP-heptose:LPS heptosyltransferase